MVLAITLGSLLSWFRDQSIRSLDEFNGTFLRHYLAPNIVGVLRIVVFRSKKRFTFVEFADEEMGFVVWGIYD